MSAHAGVWAHGRPGCRGHKLDTASRCRARSCSHSSTTALTSWPPCSISLSLCLQLRMCRCKEVCERAPCNGAMHATGWLPAVQPAHRVQSENASLRHASSWHAAIGRSHGPRAVLVPDAFWPPSEIERARLKPSFGAMTSDSRLQLKLKRITM